MTKKSETQARNAETTVVESQVAESQVAESPVVTPAVATVAKPKVGERARQLLQEGILDNKGILEQIKKEYPDAKTSIACIAWYKSDLKKKKPVDGYTQWLKDNEAKLRAEYEASLVTA